MGDVEAIKVAMTRQLEILQSEDFQGAFKKGKWRYDRGPLCDREIILKETKSSCLINCKINKNIS